MPPSFDAIFYFRFRFRFRFRFLLLISFFLFPPLILVSLSALSVLCVLFPCSCAVYQGHFFQRRRVLAIFFLFWRRRRWRSCRSENPETSESYYVYSVDTLWLALLRIQGSATGPDILRSACANYSWTVGVLVLLNSGCPNTLNSGCPRTSGQSVS